MMCTKVCGGSFLNLGGCQADDVKWWQARVFCERSGARLCTSDELQQDETRSTGYAYYKNHDCNMNTNLVNFAFHCFAVVLFPLVHFFALFASI